MSFKSLKSLNCLLILALLAIPVGCSEDEPEEIAYVDKFSDDEQKVRPLIHRDGKVTRGLEKYKIMIGEFPSTEQGLDALINRPAGLADPKKWDKFAPFIKDPADMTDPWGNPLQYKFPSESNPDKYDLWSMGPDGQDQGGAGDDILNHNVK
jgi:general secretion pathway protein G